MSSPALSRDCLSGWFCAVTALRPARRRLSGGWLSFLLLSGAMSVSAGGQPADPGKRLQPNIVVVVLDDAGFSDLGCYGSEIRTPNLDRLAASGLRFTRFDTKSICAPSRAALLTGVEPHALGMADLPSKAATRPPDFSRHSTCGELPAHVDLLPQALRRAGYSTWLLGKWHLIPSWEDGAPGRNSSFPLQRGFDFACFFKMGWTDQYHPELYEGNARLPVPTDPAYHFTTDMVDRGIRLIDAQRRERPEKPFFLYLGLGVPHAPIQVAASYTQRYAGVYERGWDALRAERFARLQRLGLVPADAQLPALDPGDPAWDTLTEQERRVSARFMATFAGFLEHGDEQIGRLVAHLEQTGLAKDTLIVVLSDNGAASESKPGRFRHPYNGGPTPVAEMDAHLDELGTDKTLALYPRAWATLGSTPYRRYKLWPHLGGVRCPLIIVPPGGARDAGGVRGQLVDIVDLAPTIAEFAGAQFASAVDGEPAVPVTGKSIRPLLASADAAPVRTVQFFELRGNRAITARSWRALTMHRPGTSFDDDVWELYDLATDPFETRNLAALHPEKLQELIHLWQKEAERHDALPLRQPTPQILAVSGFEDAFAPATPAPAKKGSSP
jgi:arylsulfatase A-like enzyme